MTLRPIMVPILVALVSTGGAEAVAQAQTETLPFDHVHLNVPDRAAAFDWYRLNFGGTPLEESRESSDRLRFGSTRFLFHQESGAAPSAGSAIDHFAFSVPDLDVTMDSLRARGVDVVHPVRRIPGLFRLAIVEDPWGTRIEVVEDPAVTGFHHVHLRGPDPAGILSWLTANFGGERGRLKGWVDGVVYRAEGFDDVWVLVQRGGALPSEGRAIDHLGWLVDDLEAKVIEFSERQVEVGTPLRLPLRADGSTVQTSQVAGPAGADFRLVQR